MKIGLIRHFKVKQPFPKKKFLTRSEVIDWFDQYDSAEIEHKKVDLHGIDWKLCYTSPLSRTLTTANQIYKGEPISATALKELDILCLLPDKIKLPFIIWGILVRIKSLSTNKHTREFKERITAFLDEVLLRNDHDTLIVSHWFVLKVLQKEMIKRGLKGDVFKSPVHGTLYIFEKGCALKNLTD